MIKAIIFDMDGVLVDAKQWHFEALNTALELFGYRISQFEHHQRFDGLPTREKLRILAKENGFPHTLSEFVNEMKQHCLLETAERLCQPNPVHLETLETLRTEGYDLALASNSIRRSVDRLMQLTSLNSLLSFTLSNEDVSQPKPSPEIYTLAIKRLGVFPNECLVVEDGDYGVAAAKAAGANVLRVETVRDVNYKNVRNRIEEIKRESGPKTSVA
ncbi:HAD family phosphatase [Stieleria sp. ICT_E10.1]|uniref:HAD family hydrolase n=1 Tax=Stieleria sedimenti TaxID=2976331 RepID=UPI00217FC254|nr:HAD family phosphatase [Stieleria sedimenti]MCS7466965.1 HAD family phosphatase [Stieleria sedimenti]